MKILINIRAFFIGCLLCLAGIPLTASAAYYYYQSYYHPAYYHPGYYHYGYPNYYHPYGVAYPAYYYGSPAITNYPATERVIIYPYNARHYYWEYGHPYYYYRGY